MKRQPELPSRDSIIKDLANLWVTSTELRGLGGKNIPMALEGRIRQALKEGKLNQLFQHLIQHNLEFQKKGGINEKLQNQIDLNTKSIQKTIRHALKSVASPPSTPAQPVHGITRPGRTGSVSRRRAAPQTGREHGFQRVKKSTIVQLLSLFIKISRN